MKHTIRDMNAWAELSKGANDFVSIARYLGAAKGNAQLANKMAQAAHMPERVSEGVRAIGLKASVAAGSTSDSSFASPLSQYNQAASAFVESLRNGPSVFDQIYTSMRRAPLHTKFSLTTIGGSGSTIAEGAARPISSLSLESHSLTEHRSHCAVVVSSELLRIGGHDAARLLDTEIRLGLATECNTELLALITAGISPIASSGSTLDAAIADVQAALNVLRLSVNSKLFCIAEPNTIKALAFGCGQGLENAFQDLTVPNGGMVRGITYLACDSLTAGQMVFVDANRLVGNAGTVELSTLEHASLQLQTTPDSPATASTITINLWQQNLVGIAAFRYYGCERLATTGVAVISGVHYTGDSP